MLDRLRDSVGAANDAALASSLGVGKSAISNWRKRESLDWPRVIALADQAEVDLDWLLLDKPLGGDGESAEGRTSVDLGPGIPVVSRIRAGLMSLYEVEHHADETIPVSQDLLAREGERLFGLRVEGDSMSPFILPGDVAVCSTVRSVEVGDDVAYYHRATGESTVKRLDALDRKTGRARLRPLNPEYETMVVQLDAGDQMALVVAVFRETTRNRRRPSFQ